MKSYERDKHYEFVGIDAEPKWAIRILKGKFKEIVVKYDDIKIETAEGVELGENFQDGVDYNVAFSYNLLRASKKDKEVNEEELGQFLGDILMNAINDGLEDGTAKIESEPEQDDSTIVTE